MLSTDTLEGWKRRYVDQGEAFARETHALDVKLAEAALEIIRWRQAYNSERYLRIDAEMMRDAHETDVRILEGKLKESESMYKREFSIASLYQALCQNLKEQLDVAHMRLAGL
jgi:hypothetical protein